MWHVFEDRHDVMDGSIDKCGTQDPNHWFGRMYVFVCGERGGKWEYYWRTSAVP